MSGLTLAGDTSGSITLNPPAIAGTTTINLPAISGGSFVVSDSSGNVGIGTSSPGTKLHVSAAGDVTFNSQIIISPLSGANPGKITFNPTTSSAIAGLSDGSLAFYGNGANTERMRIDASGNVIIGGTAAQTWAGSTYSGTSELSLSGTGEQAVAIKSNDTNGTRAKLFVASGGQTWGLWHDGTTSVKPFVLGGYTSEWMRIDTSGNVGIGNSSPTQKLDVAGTVVADLASAGQYHAVAGGGSTWYNAILRNDGSDVYFLSSSVQTTRAAAATASWNSFRPFNWNLSNGIVSMDGTGAGVLVASKPAYFCRAWVNFNGTGTVAIRANGNVSSITDNGTGDYTVNFTISIVDANYTYCLSSRKIDDVVNVGVTNSPMNTDVKSTTQFRFRRWWGTSTLEDSPELAFAVFR